MVSQNIQISFPKKLLESYQEYCREKGFKVSTRLQKLAAEDIETSKAKCNTSSNSADQQGVVDYTNKQE